MGISHVNADLMDPPEPSELLAAWRNGVRSGLDVVFPLVYAVLRSQESYLKLIRSERFTLNDRAHFLALVVR